MGELAWNPEPAHFLPIPTVLSVPPGRNPCIPCHQLCLLSSHSRARASESTHGYGE